MLSTTEAPVPDLPSLLAAYALALAAYDRQLGAAFAAVDEAHVASVDPREYPPAVGAWAAVDSMAPQNARTNYATAAARQGLDTSRLGAEFGALHRHEFDLHIERSVLWEEMASDDEKAEAEATWRGGEPRDR